MRIYPLIFWLEKAVKLEYTPYVSPFIMSTVMLFSLGIYAFRLRKRVAIAGLFSLQTFAMAIWTLCYALELSSPTLEGKILWAKMKYLGATTGPALWLVFSLYYTNHRYWLTLPLRIALGSFIFVTIAVVFTNEIHHWYWTEITMEAGYPETLSEQGFFFWIYAICMYSLVLVSVIIYYKYYRTVPVYFRRQSILMVVGTFVPLGIRILEDVVGWDPFPKIDNVILFLLLSAILYAVALFRYSALKIVPIAHSLVVQNINSGIIVLDVLGRVVELNPFVKKLLGPETQASLGQPLDVLLKNGPNIKYSPQLVEQIQEEIAFETQSQSRYFIVQVSPIWDEQKDLIGHVISLIDITDRKKAEIELEYLARTDVLTDATNRRHFFELAELEFERFKRYGHPLAIVLMDLDLFKRINDTHGHHAGDFVLKSFVSTCRKHLRTTDIFARYGGEEFICLLYEVDPRQALETTERLRQVIADTRFDFAGKSIPVTTSIGLAFAQANQTLDTVITLADRALYESKNNGRNRVTTANAGSVSLLDINPRLS